MGPIKGPDPIVRGTEKLSCTDCTPLTTNGASADFNTNAIPAGTWYFDKSHSNVMWETPYRGMGSYLTGRFNYFVLKNLTFDEAVPANIAFEGYVRLNSVNTGEPGRDGGCLLSTYGTAASKTSEPENIASLVSLPGTGRYSATDDGFFVDANLTFHGFTKKVVVKLFYEKQTDQQTYTLAGISAEFEFLALSDFGIVSTNIADKVKIRLNSTLRNKK
jgi:polyisoprenoid-binding protein YceI